MTPFLRPPRSRHALFLDGESEESFLSDQKFWLAHERLLEVLGEALARAREDDPSLVKFLPEVRQIEAMRNRIAHVYDGIDYRLMWQVVAVRVPEFAPQLEAALASATIGEDE